MSKNAKCKSVSTKSKSRKKMAAAKRTSRKSKSPAIKKNAFDPPIPTTREELRRFVSDQIGILIPDRSACEGHHTPMDYLAASFLGQEDLLVWANRGGGKTYLAAAATLVDAIFRPGTTICVLGGSFDQSDRLADYIRDLIDRQEQLASLVKGRITRTMVELVNGSRIKMLPQSQRAVRGQHVQKVRCDEADLFDSQIWRAVQFVTKSREGVRGSIEVLSTLHRSGGLMQKLVDDNMQSSGAVSQSDNSPPPAAPDQSRSGGYRLIRWCLWEVIERCPPQRLCTQCPLKDDCCGVAKSADGFFRIDDAIAIKSRSSSQAWGSEMLCRGMKRDWLVFEQFDRARHVGAVDFCHDWPVYRAIDFGYRSPMVCLWIQITPGGCVNVIDEYVKQRLPIGDHAREIIRRDPAPAAATYVDPAGKQKESTSGVACTEMLASEGIHCTYRTSAIVDGLELIRSAVSPADGQIGLKINPRCRQLIDAFENYHYPPPEAAGADRSLPVKDGPDHLIDALRYFFVNKFRPKMEVKRCRY